MPDAASSFRHGHTIEHRVLSKRTPLDRVQIEQWRYVCACGYATRWSQREARARRNMLTVHGVDGQLSVS